MTATATVIKLTGQSLVDYVNDHSDLTKTELVLQCGYVRSNGSPAFVEFYTELLKAKEILDPNYISKQDAEDQHYDSLDKDTQQLYDTIHDRIGKKWDHEDIISFIDELDDIGIETSDQFDDAFDTIIDSHNAEAEFAEQWVVNGYSIPDVIEHAIDWQYVWYHQLAYDYNTIVFDDSTYFFRNL